MTEFQGNCHGLSPAKTRTATILALGITSVLFRHKLYLVPVKLMAFLVDSIGL